MPYEKLLTVPVYNTMNGMKSDIKSDIKNGQEYILAEVKEILEKQRAEVLNEIMEMFKSDPEKTPQACQ